MSAARSLAFWKQDRVGRLWAGQGDSRLLDQSLTAFFASRQCPGVAIRLALDWAVEQARTRQAVISGFHSPLEQSVLKVLLAAGSPAVVALSRPVDSARLAPDWNPPLFEGRLVVISHVANANRLTNEGSISRNKHVAELANTIGVAYASLGGSMATLSAQWQAQGRDVQVLSSG